MPASYDRPEPQRLPPPARGWKETFWIGFGILLCAIGLAAASIYTAPPLISDWQVKDAARPATETRVSDGKCSTKILITICDLTLTLPTASGAVSRRVNYVFTGLNGGDVGVRPMADPARPAFVTTDLGLDRLWNRTITLAVIMVALLAFIVLPIVSIVRGRRSGA